MIERPWALPWLFVLLTGAADPAGAADPLNFRVELERYYEALAPVCRTGVTPGMVERYHAAVAAVDAAKYGGGRDNNFFGVKTPEQFHNDCLQSDGAHR